MLFNVTFDFPVGAVPCLHFCIWNFAVSIFRVQLAQNIAHDFAAQGPRGPPRIHRTGNVGARGAHSGPADRWNWTFPRMRSEMEGANSWQRNHFTCVTDVSEIEGSS